MSILELTEPNVFLRNCWYVASVSREVGRQPRAVRLLDEPVVLYRRQDGSPVALEDACPHRKLPLSMGRIKGDAIECGYHGLTFDGCGTCIEAPTQERIPAMAKVRSYPVQDRYGLLWIWMGEPEQAEHTPVLQIDNHDHPDWHMTAGDSLPCKCHYLWLVDNLLDPSHVAWVHRSTFAASGTEDTPLQVQSDEHGVICSRWMYGRPPPPFYAPLVKFEGPADRLQHYEVRVPSIAINRSTFAPAGLGGPDAKDDPRIYRMVSYNFLTPVDADNTLYFWLQHRNTDAHDQGLTERIAAGAKAAFEEDRHILEAVHQGMKHKRTPAIGLLLDTGAARLRKMLAERIAAERGPATTRNTTESP
jgi:vanillate O-demethylase monooxygenase subunit